MGGGSPRERFLARRATRTAAAEQGVGRDAPAESGTSARPEPAEARGETAEARGEPADADMEPAEMSGAAQTQEESATAGAAMDTADNSVGGPELSRLTVGGTGRASGQSDARSAQQPITTPPASGAALRRLRDDDSSDAGTSQALVATRAAVSQSEAAGTGAGSRASQSEDERLEQHHDVPMEPAAPERSSETAQPASVEHVASTEEFIGPSLPARLRVPGLDQIDIEVREASSEEEENPSESDDDADRFEVEMDLRLAGLFDRYAMRVVS